MKITLSRDNDIGMFTAFFHCEPEDAEMYSDILRGVVENDLGGKKQDPEQRRVTYGDHYIIMGSTLEIHSDEWFPLEVFSNSSVVLQDAVNKFQGTVGK